MAGGHAAPRESGAVATLGPPPPLTAVSGFSGGQVISQCFRCPGAAEVGVHSAWLLASSRVMANSLPTPLRPSAWPLRFHMSLFLIFFHYHGYLALMNFSTSVLLFSCFVRLVRHRPSGERKKTGVGRSGLAIAHSELVSCWAAACVDVRAPFLSVCSCDMARSRAWLLGFMHG